MRRLDREHAGEAVDGRSRPWSAGAGSGALATGLVQMAWVLERVGSAVPGLRCTIRPEPWLAGNVELFVWEAFVSGTGKPVPAGITQHAADAAAAADTFLVLGSSTSEWKVSPSTWNTGAWPLQ